MKTINLLGAMASGLVMLSACSSEADLTVSGGDLASAKQEIVLQVSNTGSGLSTRAGRPLYSQEAKQAIDNVTVIICNAENQVVYTKTIDNWEGMSNEYTEGAHGRETSLKLEGDDQLDAGTYTVYAIGYTKNENEDSDYDLTEIETVKKGETFNPDVKISLKENSDVVGEEIFAGDATVTLAEKAGFKTSVVLNRQVAGAFGYFKNIPYVEGATTLRLVTRADLNSTLVLGNFYNSTIAGNGAAGTDAKYVVNGINKTTEKVIYSIDLANWFDNLTEEDGKVGGDWKNPYPNANFEEGSVFGGNFIIPFAKSTGAKTFALELCNENGKELKSWTVKLPENDLTQAGQLFDGKEWAAWTGTETTTSYSIVRNHLYGLGVRTLDNPDNPEPGPDPDPDDPEDLLKAQELTLKVCDNWEVIHKMEIEED